MQRQVALLPVHMKAYKNQQNIVIGLRTAIIDTNNGIEPLE